MRSGYQYYTITEEDRLAHEARATEERNAIEAHRLEHDLYQASMRVLIHPTRERYASLAQRLPNGKRDAGYRLVRLYATLDSPAATYEDRLEAWRLYRGDRSVTADMCEALEPMRTGMNEWTRVLHINLRAPGVNKGVQDALMDMYTHGGPSVREEQLSLQE